MYYYYPHTFNFFGNLLEVIFWIAIIFLIIKVVKNLKAGHHSFNLGKSALDILKERYAKGEIEKAEFETKKKDLS
jgi:putative membrane protein